MATARAGLRGIVYGKTINLDEASGLADGQYVKVAVQPVSPRESTGEELLDALRRAAGSWSDDPALVDWFLEWNRQRRKAN